MSPPGVESRTYLPMNEFRVPVVWSSTGRTDEIPKKSLGVLPWSSERRTCSLRQYQHSCLLFVHVAHSVSILWTVRVLRGPAANVCIVSSDFFFLGIPLATTVCPCPPLCARLLLRCQFHGSCRTPGHPRRCKIDPLHTLSLMSHPTRG